MKIRVAFSGSGFLAPVHAGAICALMDCGIDIVEVAGTSGGSIAAALVASGMTADHIHEVAQSDIPDGIMSLQPWSILTKRAMNSGAVLREWLGSVLGVRTLGECTIPITIMATDIAGGKGVALSNVSHPHVMLADACRASASVPFVWSPHSIDGVEYCDGGMVNNIPTDVLIDDGIVQLGIDVQDGSPAGGASSLIGLGRQCLQVLVSSNESNVIAWAKQTGAHIVSVNAEPYNFLDASISTQGRDDLFKRGYAAVADWVGRTYNSVV